MATPIRNIVLDTSFIEGQNFLEGIVFGDLKKISRKRWGHLFITDIVYREVFSRFRQRLITEAEKSRNIQNLIENQLKTLKNSEAYKAFFNLPTVDLDAACAAFKVKFDRYIKEARIKTIPTGHLTIEKIFDDYFNAAPPFGSGEKKSEFPDAFSYQAIKEYFEKHKDDCYLVTSDKDFDGLPTTVVIPVKQAAIALDAIIRFEEEKKSRTPAFIGEMFDRDKVKIEKQAHQLITAYLEEEVSSRGEIGGMEVDVLDHIDLSDIDITGYAIVSLGEGEARLECPANFAYELDIAVEDKSDAWYDKEDDRWHFVESTSVTVKDSHDVMLTIIVEFDEDLIDAEFEVESINDGQGFSVFGRWDHEHY
ncbi:hypothetical protein BDD43_4338 [Mucilaginibacter gracilis]|uniref:DUF4935 domain-containing protein n=1 Tax=Mucilaginibacter gracilis TaxID=423350 RepID=A0A495J5V8_9SPHI|nr:PIN domain-containing protein [Mucilaginibacter gracilis]RKR84111.1 hypothetical protein BDD43_4338 [Mucilaginibacter gracilis]